MGYKLAQTQIKRELVIWKPRFKEAVAEYFLNMKGQCSRKKSKCQEEFKKKKKILLQIPLWWDG